MSLGRAMAAVARAVLDAREFGRLTHFRHDAGLHGYDPFGLHPEGVAAGLALFLPLYRCWFRVTSRGIENLPTQGPTIAVANHGGLLPFDAMMLWTDIVLRSNPLRVPRFVLDNFVLRIPFVSPFYARGGSIGGNRRNVHHLLDRGELLVIFPEGVNGVGKTRSQRYQLQSWSVGHAEMAIRHAAPVVPVAMTGPDDQFPLSFRLPVHAFGAPYVPLAVPPVPLPVQYRIVYGDPIDLHRRWAPHEADLPDVVAEAAAQVRVAVQSLLDRVRRETTH